MVKLEEHKSRTEGKKIEILPPSQRVYIPLSQHLGKVCLPEVKAQDFVLMGQKIGSVEAHVFSPIHASVSGRVFGISEWPHPASGRCKAVIIDNDGKDKPAFSSNLKSSEEIKQLSASEIRQIVFEAGIVGMGGASFPTHIKLNPPVSIKTLIINGAECEPYLTSDDRLMTEKTDEVIFGIELIKRCVLPQEVYIAIEDNKPEAIKIFEDKLKNTGYKLKVMKSIYPQGGEKQLIKNILKKEVPRGKLPFDVGVVVHNVATVFAVYEAVYKNKPLYERIVTVTGSCLKNPKNLLVRIGTPIKELIDFCSPLSENPEKIIAGGPMMGIAQYSLETPVIKSTNGIICMTKKEAQSLEEQACIRCGRCVEYCPMGLMPCLISMAAEKEKWDLAKTYGCLDCIECGLCNYVCPQSRKIVQVTKQAKQKALR